MKKASVSLLVTSQSMSLAELTANLGRAHSPGSHNKGDVSAGAKLGKPLWSVIVWRFDSDAPETAPVEQHLERLEIQFPAAELKRVLPAGCDVSVDIALFFDTANVSATIPRRGIEIIDAYGAKLEVNCYPSTFKT
jgi:hypothetical protein